MYFYLEWLYEGFSIIKTIYFQIYLASWVSLGKKGIISINTGSRSCLYPLLLAWAVFLQKIRRPPFWVTVPNKAHHMFQLRVSRSSSILKSGFRATTHIQKKCQVINPLRLVLFHISLPHNSFNFGFHTTFSPIWVFSGSTCRFSQTQFGTFTVTASRLHSRFFLNWLLWYHKTIVAFQPLLKTPIVCETELPEDVKK